MPSVKPGSGAGSISPAPEISFRAPNARTGEAYDHVIDVLGAPQSSVTLCAIGVPEPLGLRGDPASGRITGTPAVAGNYDITVSYRLVLRPGDPPLQTTFRLSVNLDPKSMWRNLPSDSAAPYWRPDEESGAIRGPEMAILAASKRGRSHAHVGSFRDDAFRIDHVNGAGWYLAVVADGAGSARFSRRGAQLICDVARERTRSALGGAVGALIDTLAAGQTDASREQLHTTLTGVLGNAAYYAAQAIADECGTRAADLRAEFHDYLSTAMVVLAKRYCFGTLCAAYWVGDGAVGAYSKRDGITLLGESDGGEYAGQTRFLDSNAVSQDALRKRTRYAVVDDLTALVVMTDGISDPKFETEARLARQADWDAFWSELEPNTGDEAALLAWLDFWSQGNHDDRTIVIIQ